LSPFIGETMILSQLEQATVRQEQDALILSFPRPVPILSWAVLNGGFCHARYVVNHHVESNDVGFAADPEGWLTRQVQRLQLEGEAVVMATGVNMSALTQVSLSGGGSKVICFTTVGLGNALSVGDSALFQEHQVLSPHTINMILLVHPGLRQEAMVEAVQIATEGRVRALYENGIKSCRSGLPATGTGTDCVAVVSLGDGVERYCGKHTKLGELIGGTAYMSVAKGLALSTEK
jgi:adenosylcobinamide hydrolase